MNKTESERRTGRRSLMMWLTGCLLCLPIDAAAQTAVVPEGTEPLTMEGDPASLMVDGIDRFLLRQIDRTAAARADRFVIDCSSREAFEQSLVPHRSRLAECLGIRDKRVVFTAPEVITEVGGHPIVARSGKFTVSRIRCPVLHDPSPQTSDLVSVSGEGLLLTPVGEVLANVIVLPDADQSPEQVCGLTEGLPEEFQTARHLAEFGCRVVVPQLISRRRQKRAGRADLTNREYLHRVAFELGRTTAGWEIQMTLSLVDWFTTDDPKKPVGIRGYGEGGMLALFAAALDRRIHTVSVAGFWGPRERSWEEPLDRNFFGLLRDFGAVESALMVAPRNLLIVPLPGPELVLDGNGGAPAVLSSPAPDAVRRLLQELHQRLTTETAEPSNFCNTAIVEGAEEGDSAEISLAAREIGQFLRCLQGSSPSEAGRSADASADRLPQATPLQFSSDEAGAGNNTDGDSRAEQREHRLVQQIDRHHQALLRESPFVRQEFTSDLDTDSVTAYSASVEKYREIFRKDVIGDFELPLLPFNARSRRSWETEAWTGYEVTLDVFPDVFAYGILLVPADLKPGERRPVVVCQHGLEGRPVDIIQSDHRAYHDFAAKLCERGYITFSPQNPYIFTDRFRTLQRKAQPLGRSLFSIIVPQHQQIVNWLRSQSYVDGERIAFYGLSYGGKSAMRIPALVTDYCLSVCSADFNEWVLKNASTRENFSYVWTGEYEIFEWNLGSTFNYAEMAALICPRPFMVERGHFDGVGEDHWVAHEYAKVRNLYAARLKIGDRTEIEWFDGPHTINGQGTFRFLDKHLRWSPSE